MGEGSLVEVPRNKTADIVRVRFTHTDRRAVTTMRLRDYGGRWIYTGLIKTPTRNFVVVGWVQRARKHFVLFKGIEHPIVVPCDGISSKVDRAKNTFRVSIPTDCLKQPRWVRMGLRLLRAPPRRRLPGRRCPGTGLPKTYSRPGSRRGCTRTERCGGVGVGNYRPWANLQPNALTCRCPRSDLPMTGRAGDLPSCSLPQLKR